MAETTITNLPNAAALTGTERVPMDQGGTTVDATTAAIAALAPGTSLGYDPATRLLSSSTGADVTLPLVSTTAAGLIPHTWLTGAEAAILPHIHGALAGVLYEHVRNVSGAVMPALTPYHVVGSQGDTDRVQIVPADASDPQTMPASGILATALANNEDGHGVIAGVPTGLNTVANPSGTTLYVGSAVLTPTPPATNIQAIAVVGRSHATTGTLSMLQGPSLGGAAALNVGTTAGTVAAGNAPAAAITALKAEANPLPQYLQPNEVVAGTNMSVDTTTTPGSVILNATGGGSTPGGTSGQLQWNSSGAFAGLGSSSIDGSGNMTFSARWIQSVNGAASAPPLSLTGTWFTGGTTTSTKPHFLIEPSTVTVSNNWSTAGTGFGVNAPSGFAGNLLDLQVNGVRACSITQSQVFIPQGSEAAPGLAVGAANSGIVGIGSGTQNLGIVQGGLNYINLSDGTVRMPSGVSLGWCNNVLNQAAPDLFLFRDTANTLAQRNGTAAQASRIYNTFTSDTNFERLNIRWTSNEAIIDTEAGGGGGTLRGLKIGSASTSLLGFYGATPGARPAAVADATDAATVITQLNALLARIRTLGLIAT